mmetsp:Transcript_41555/g.81508  ORF Transcript_41555/g.81508 Transcript_41555/m.81508 type:complete len:91 (-) Transcript_41555:70-342(-)
MNLINAVATSEQNRNGKNFPSRPNFPTAHKRKEGMKGNEKSTMQQRMSPYNSKTTHIQSKHIDFSSHQLRNKTVVHAILSRQRRPTSNFY